MTEIDKVKADLKAHMSVLAAVSSGYEVIYRRLDKLHQRGIHDDEVVKALRDMGETELLEGYVEWAEIDIREDGADTDPMAVPDPHDAPSYATWSADGQRYFTTGDLLDKLMPVMPYSYVMQTGGGTATLVFRKTQEDAPIIGGPGSYNWNVPRFSTFSTGEFYYGPDTIGVDGEDPKHDEPGEIMDPAWTLDQLAEKIKAAYAQYNPEGVTK